jgi:hypothetical protein
LTQSSVVKLAPITVIETPEFIQQVADLLRDDERVELIDYVARNPEAGVVMRGTGGVRKLRWGLQGRGKRGGARVIYYYHNGTMPIFLLTVFPKNVKVDLNQAQKNALRSLIPLLIQSYEQRGLQ